MAGKAIFRASARSARRPGYELRTRARRAIQSAILDEFAGNLAPSATRIARQFAPHRSGRLSRGLSASVTSRGGRITVTLDSAAVSDEGYPYTAVTRFGHRKQWIYPKPPNTRLRFFSRSAGRVIFPARVRGYKPLRDWVTSVSDAIEQDLTAAENRIGRQIVSRVLG
jgi:hypothetical protein